MRSLIIIIILGISLLAAGCATKAGTGTAVGGAAGGAIGYAIGGTGGMLIGALAGGALGYGVGKSLDEEDRRRAAYALEQNQMMQWQNERTGRAYRIEPTQTTHRSGRECRDYRLVADVEGRPDEITGTACRRPDGTWEAVGG
jgi:surface antigen